MAESLVPVFRDGFELLDYEPETGVSSWFRYNADDDTFTMRETQDAEVLMEINKRQFNGHDESARFGDGLEKMGSIPITTFYEHGLNKMDPEQIKKFLNDRDFSKFRTRPGRL